ncbi:hypothetical protein ACO1O0_002654 [Amphichorda felina]
MCTSNEYTYVYPDGRQEKPQRQHMLCPASRHGVPCADTVIYRYPPKSIPFTGQPSSAPAAGSPYLSAQFPPTPTYTPRSSTPNYRSGDESDRSAGYHSSSSNNKKHPPTVYINGKKVYDSSPSRGSERFVIVDGPPSPRTTSSSSRAYGGSPNTTPSSPVSPYMVPTGRPRRRESSASSARRPVIVNDGGPRVAIDIVDGPEGRRHHRKEHRRHPSSSSYYSYDEGDATASRRHHRKESSSSDTKQQRRQAQRDALVADRIAQANAEIAGRTKVPQQQQAKQTHSSSSSSGSRRSGAFSQADLADAMRRVDIKDSGEREWQRQQDAEDEAQRRRLKERMTGLPRRSATVSHGTRRPRVYYQDASY